MDDAIIDSFLLRYHIKQLDYMLLWLCSVINHRGRQNMVRTKKWHTRRSQECGTVFSRK